MQPGGKLSGCKVADQSGQNAEQQSEEYIGGIVHIQIQTGKSDEYRQDYGRDTQTPVIFQDGCGRRKGCKGMSRGKGEIGGNTHGSPELPARTVPIWRSCSWEKDTKSMASCGEKAWWTMAM